MIWTVLSWLALVWLSALVGGVSLGYWHARRDGRTW